jgi:4-amino-4-deoxy-L-arabinose transferase-like glycosyltransferase
MTLGLVSFVLLHYLFLIFLTAAAFAFGARLTHKVTFANRLEWFVVSTATGLGALGTLAFLLGLLRILYAPLVLILLSAILATGYTPLREITTAAARKLRDTSWWVIALVAAVALAGSQLLLLPLYPPTQWDSTSYHFAVAGIYAREHAVVFTPYLRSPVFPQLNELLFTVAMLLYDDLAAQLVQMLFLLLIGATLYCWARRSGSPASAGMWAAAIWISSPLVMMLGSTGYVEIALTCFLTLGAYALFVWYQTREHGWLLLGGAMLGFAEGVKYLALFPILLAGLILIFEAARKRFSKECVTDVLAFTAMVIVIAGPWHARITWYTGNPIWPYAAKILGGGPWPLEHIQLLLRDQFHPGAGSGLKALLMLPWNLTFNAEKLFWAELQFTPVIFYLLPLPVIAAIWNRHVRFLLLLVVLYTTFWFYSAQNARYLVHAVPLLCLACGTALAELVSRVRLLRGSPLATAAICVVLAMPGYRKAKVASFHGWIAMPSEMPPSSKSQRDAYISSRIPEYKAVDYLNTHKGSYTLYSFPNSNLAAYVNGTFVGDWYGPARYQDYLARLEDPEALYRFFCDNNVQYLLLSQVNGPSGAHSDETLVPKFMNGHLRLIYAEDSLIYEVTPSLWELQDTPELLRNNELEEKFLSDVPPGWEMQGRPQMDTSGKESFLGTTSVAAYSSNWLEQTVPVEPGAIYIHRALVRPTVPRQFGVIHIDWLDSSGKTINQSTRYISGPVDWLARATAVTAPSQAVNARIHAASTGPEFMWFDFFSFRKLSYK